MIKTALTIAARGLFVFPCSPRAKTPATAHGVKDATTDPDMIRQWWQRVPDYNVAVATGSTSSIFVVDLDGFDAEAELRRLELKYGNLPCSVEVITARGRHIYFKTPAVLVRNSAGRIAPGIDVRGEGGYVLVPPSVHPSGRQYCWSVDTANTFADAPKWLLTKIAAAPDSTAAAPPSEWRELVRNGVSEGQRDCTITRLAGHLLRRRIDPFVTLALLQTWNATRCTPPLPEIDIERIVESIAGKELRRRQGDGG
jgi:Bifunctional DNA primase/polymerase, N-terminal/Primase C terminal 1 (PriCT-1)